MAEDVLIAKRNLLRLSKKLLDQVKNAKTVEEIVTGLRDTIYIFEKLCLMQISLKKASEAAGRKTEETSTSPKIADDELSRAINSLNEGASSKEIDCLSGSDPARYDNADISSTFVKCVHIVYQNLVKQNSKTCARARKSASVGRCEGCEMHLSRLVFRSSLSSSLLFSMLSSLDLLIVQSDLQIMVGFGIGIHFFFLFIRKPLWLKLS